MSLNRPALAPRRLARSGFTLIELVIVVIVLGVLTAVALPSFMDSIRKGRRAEAFAAIAKVQQAQERWRSNNPAYAGALTSLALPAATAPGGYYTISVAVGTDADVAYTVTADGSSGSQASDSTCAKLSARVTRGAVTYASCANCSSFTYAATDKCWAQ